MDAGRLGHLQDGRVCAWAEAIEDLEGAFCLIQSLGWYVSIIWIHMACGMWGYSQRSLET